MADDLLGGVLGGGDEQPETEVPQALAGAEAFAAAIAAIASRQDPGVARKTEAFLDEQTRLLETQRRHLEDEHTSRLTQLRLTIAAAKRKRYADHVRNWVYTGIALLVLALLVGAARMIAEAMSDSSLIFEGFTVPADLVAQGASSEALANDFVTRMGAIRAVADETISPAREVREAGTNALKVQIPETGISLDELERFLHRWLGHQTVLSGQVLDEPDGRIAIALDVQGDAPIEVQGPRAALGALMQQAAEQVYAALDPVPYGNYLGLEGHLDEALQLLQRDTRSRALARRVPLLVYCPLASYDPDRRRALAEALVAADLDPRNLCGWREASSASANLGHDQAAVEFGQRVLTMRRPENGPADRRANAAHISGAHIFVDRAMGDFVALGKDFESEFRRLPPQPYVHERYAVSAEVAALLHDETRSRQELARALVTGPVDTDVLTARWNLSVSAQDWAQALDAAKALVAQGEAQKSAAPSPEFAARPELMLATHYRPRLAYAEAMTGDIASATALISQTPTDCYLCVRMRARIAAVAARAAAAAADAATATSDAATADHWFAEAVRQAPDLPMAYYEWGEALLARGDLAGAARELSLAHDKGPHFADALKGWGDVLAKQGHWKDALAKYDEALKYAPSWAALEHARADAVAKQRS